MPRLILQLILAAAQDIKDDDMHVSEAPDMGLCNTTELMDMLDGYYKADLNDNQHEDRSGIHTGMDCNDTALALDFQGKCAAGIAQCIGDGSLHTCMKSKK